MSSPGSTTIASRVCSSPNTEQLHASIPTVRISWIISRLYTQHMAEALSVIMRWLHITSMTTLIGGMLYGRLVAARASESLTPDAREALGERAATAQRPMVYGAIAGLLISGVYNILTHPGHTPS